MGNQEVVTIEEKIDYIYRTLKAQRKREIFSRITRRIFRIAILAYLVYFYFFGWKIMINMITGMATSMLGADMTNMLQTQLVNGFKAGIQSASTGTGEQQALGNNTQTGTGNPLTSGETNQTGTVEVSPSGTTSNVDPSLMDCVKECMLKKGFKAVNKN